MNPEILIKKFDEFLVREDKTFSGVVIGAAALYLLGYINRETVDVDILAPKISAEIQNLAEDFRMEMDKKGIELIPQWINNGPESLLQALPRDWSSRTALVFSGKAITLSTLGRPDLLKTKLFAYCDRGEDLEDCLKMKPSRNELLEGMQWVKRQDANPLWPEHVEKSFNELAKKLGYEL